MARLASSFKSLLRQHGIVGLCVLIAVIIYYVPLQHFMPLSRFQHYSFCLCSLAAGLCLQSLFCWRTLGLWGKLSMLSGALFVGSCACFFYTNPWLGNPDLATDEQLYGRQRFIIFLTVALVPVSYFWIRFGCQKQPQTQRDKSAEERLSP